MQNPFTTTFNKMPDLTYVATESPTEIIENFSFDNPSESVYKITGVRGSRKTVILAKVEEVMRSSEYVKKGWLVFDLNPVRDMLGQVAAMLQKEGLGNSSHKNKSINISASVLGTGSGVGITSEKDFFDIGVEIDEMLEKAQKKGKKILIGIDEVSKSQEMVKFASEYAQIKVCPFFKLIYRNLNFCEPVAFITFIPNTIDVAFHKITADFISIFFYIFEQLFIGLCQIIIGTFVKNAGGLNFWKFFKIKVFKFRFCFHYGFTRFYDDFACCCNIICKAIFGHAAFASGFFHKSTHFWHDFK